MKAVIFIAVAFCVFIIGYRLGYKDCFEYLKQKLKEAQDHVDKA